MSQSFRNKAREAQNAYFDKVKKAANAELRSIKGIFETDLLEKMEISLPDSSGHYVVEYNIPGAFLGNGRTIPWQLRNLDEFHNLTSYIVNDLDGRGDFNVSADYGDDGTGNTVWKLTIKYKL